MGKIYKYHTGRHTIKDYPTREDIYADKEKLDLEKIEEFIFYPVDISSAYSRYIYGNHVKGYTLIVSGVLPDGNRVQIIISEIKLYFDIRLPPGDKHKAIIREIKELLKDDEDDMKIIKAYPGIGFHKDMTTFLRVYFDNIFTRRKYLTLIQEKKLKLQVMLKCLVCRMKYLIEMNGH